MRARLHDPGGPAWAEWARHALWIGLVLGGLFSPMNAASWGLLALGVLLWLPYPLVFGRWSPRDVVIETAPGCVRVRGAGFLDQTIAVTHLNGASAASEGGKTSFALQQAGRSGQPTVLEVDDAATAKAIRDSLGIGAKGFGALTWEIGPAAYAALDVASRVSATVLWLVFALTTVAGAEGGDLSLLSGFGLIGALIMSAVVVFISVQRIIQRPETVTLATDAVEINTEGEVRRLPLPVIVRVIAKSEGIAFATRELSLATVVPTPFIARGRGGITEEERDHLVLHLDSALTRANNVARPHPEALLGMRRAENESARVWLVRLEVAAAAMLAGGAYRGGSVDEPHLWDIVEDHDSDPSTRATAARLLTRLEPEKMKVRVAPLLSAVRNDHERTLLRIALEPDIDLAVRELEELESRMLRRLP